MGIKKSFKLSVGALTLEDLRAFVSETEALPKSTGVYVMADNGQRDPYVTMETIV